MVRRLMDLPGRTLAATLFAAVVSVACSGAEMSSLLSGEGGVQVDASSRTDAHPHDSGSLDGADGAPGVPCGTSECTLVSQTCCRKHDKLECTAATACHGLSIPCANAADCAAGGYPGDVCCGEFDKADLVVQVGCVSPGDCRYSDYRVVLCSKSAADACPGGETCETSSVTLPGFDLCIKTVK